MGNGGYRGPRHQRFSGGFRDGSQRGKLQLLVVAAQIDLRERQLHGLLDVRDLFLGFGRADLRSQVVVAALGQVLGGREAHLRIRKTKLERRERRL